MQKKTKYSKFKWQGFLAKGSTYFLAVKAIYYPKKLRQNQSVAHQEHRLRGFASNKKEQK